MTSADPPLPAERAAPEAELKHGAISFLDALVIGLASTSPAYSLAVDHRAGRGARRASTRPGVVLASFVPMLLIASAFYYLNRADQDCGTTFSWVTRAMGPWFGWIGGWAIAMTGVLVVGSLADVAVRFGLLTVGLDSLDGEHTADRRADGGGDRRDDGSVRDRYRHLGALPERADPAAGGIAAGLRRASRSTARSRAAAPSTRSDPVDHLAQPVRRGRRRADRRPAARRLRLLGLGVGGQPHRGDRGLGVGPGPGRHRLDGRAAGRPTCPWPTRWSPTPGRTS